MSNGLDPRIADARTRVLARAKSLRESLIAVEKRRDETMREAHRLRTENAPAELVELVDMLAYADRWLSITIGQAANQLEAKSWFSPTGES